ncbi:unnamed protein product [Prorocentrum cordatum]|uniref:Apple domain-containing protein n=1 Tax=Prorocentrum cordatum TaxID=2364126 RepID=A0ABN9Y974_9DINO|nr:unnamed protein product [Polarella glacialis]
MGRESRGGRFDAVSSGSDGDESGEERVEHECAREDGRISRRELVCHRAGARLVGRALPAARRLGAAGGLAACGAAALCARCVPRQALLRAVWGAASDSVIYAGDPGDGVGTVVGDSLDPAAWDYHRGHNCYLSHGGAPIRPGEVLNDLSIGECTGKCQADPQCEAVVTQHNKDKGQCSLISSVHLGECARRSGYDLWLRTDFSTTTSTLTITRTVTSARAADPTTTTSTTSRPTTSTTTTTYARPGPVAWRAHTGYNCFVGHGGLPVEDRPVPLPDERSLGDCQKECESVASCTGVTMKQDVATGLCWLQAHVEPSSCITGTDFSTWLVAPPSTSRKPPSRPAGQGNDSQGRPSENRSAALANTSAEDAREPGGEWSVRTGLNCFSGNGAHHLGPPEPGTNEPAPLVLGLDDCKAECERQAECDGFVLHPSAHLCWPCSDVVPDECMTSTVYELWVRPARASARGDDGGNESQPEASVHTPEPTARSANESSQEPSPHGASAETLYTVQSADEPPRTWSSLEGVNCFIGTGSGEFPDGSDGSVPGSCSLAECQAACEAQVGCQAVTVRRGQQGDESGPCFLRAQLRLESCLPDSPYDLWRLDSDPARAHEGGPPNSSTEGSGGAAPKTGAPPPAKPPPQEGGCPACAPSSVSPPAVVLPFYERDLCKAQYTARSIALHDTGSALGDVLLLWISTQPSDAYAEGIQAIRDSLAGSRKVELLDLSPQVNGNHKDGWYAQQVLKLKAASRVNSEYFVVLDSKNTLLQDVNAQTFLTECRQARLFGTYPWGQLPKLHQELSGDKVHHTPRCRFFSLGLAWDQNRGLAEQVGLPSGKAPWPQPCL